MDHWIPGFVLRFYHGSWFVLRFYHGSWLVLRFYHGSWIVLRFLDPCFKILSWILDCFKILVLRFYHGWILACFKILSWILDLFYGSWFVLILSWILACFILWSLFYLQFSTSARRNEEANKKIESTLCEQWIARPWKLIRIMIRECTAYDDWKCVRWRLVERV